MGSQRTEVRFSPTLGWTDLPPHLAPPGSMISGMNLWVREGRLEPRDGLGLVGLTSAVSEGLGAGEVCVGAFPHYTSDGSVVPMLVFGNNNVPRHVAYLQTDSTWTTLAYQTAPVNDPPFAGMPQPQFANGVSVYLPRHDENMLVMCDGRNQCVVWQGPNNPTSTTTRMFSTLTGAPAARDIVLYDERPVLWGIVDPSTVSVYATRLQWPLRHDCEDWTGPGSGYHDLPEIMGKATRIFADGGTLICATDREIWLGQPAGDPFVFQFTPLTRMLGIEDPRAATQLPEGIFWVNSDLMLRRLVGGQITEIGKPIWKELRETVPRTTVTRNHPGILLGAHPAARQLMLWYSAASAGGGDAQFNANIRCFMYHLDEEKWTPHRTSAISGVRGVFAAPVAWDSTLTAHTVQTDLPGRPWLGCVVDSNGSVFAFNSEVTSDWSLPRAIDGVFTGFLPAPLDSTLFLDEARMIFTTVDSASSLSVDFSMNAGVTYSSQSRTALSTGSGPAGSRNFYPMISGRFGAVRLQSESSGFWRLADIELRARVVGRDR